MNRNLDIEIWIHRWTGTIHNRKGPWKIGVIVVARMSSARGQQEYQLELLFDAPKFILISFN